MIGLEPVEDAGVAGLLVEEEAEDGEVEDGQPEAHRGEVLVLLHEEVGAVADVEVGHDEGEPGQREHKVGEAVAGQAAAEAQLTGRLLLVLEAGVPAILYVIIGTVPTHVGTLRKVPRYRASCLLQTFTCEREGCLLQTCTVPVTGLPLVNIYLCVRGLPLADIYL